MEALDCAIYNDIKLESSPTKEAQDFLATMLKSAQTPNYASRQPFIIFINPFSNAATHTLPLSAFLDLIAKVLDLAQTTPNYNICVLVITFPSVHNDFIDLISKALQSPTLTSRLFIYPNDNSLQNLIALSNLCNLIISPSTGSIHIASNLGVKTIGLYSPKDTIKWATRDKVYVIIPKQKQKLTSIECENIINQTLCYIQDIIDSNKSTL